MTKFASPAVLRCPQCGDHVLRSRLKSFNDFGAMGWSDGYTSIWGLNAISPIGRCPWCKSVFWLDDAENMGSMPHKPSSIGLAMRLVYRLTGDKYGELERERIWRETPWEWKSAKHVDAPMLNDWWSVLENLNTLNPARGILARRQLWWRGNDHLRIARDGKPISDKPKLDDQQIRGNLEELYALSAAEEKPNLLAMGEMLRELGRFDEAIATLDSIEDDEENTV